MFTAPCAIAAGQTLWRAVPQVGVEDAARGDRRDHHRCHEPAAAVLVVRRRDQDQRQVEAPVDEPGDDGGPAAAGELLDPRQHVSAPADLLGEEEDRHEHQRDDEVQGPASRPRDAVMSKSRRSATSRTIATP